MSFLNKRLCIFYIFTALVISIFVSHMIVSFYEQRSEIERLRDDVNAIAQRQNRPSPEGSKCSDGNCGGNCGKNPTEQEPPSKSLETKTKNQLKELWDSIMSLRMDIRNMDCSKNTVKQAEKPPTCQQNLDKPTTALQMRTNYASEDLGAKIGRVVAEPIGGSTLTRQLLNLDFIKCPPINMLRPSMSPGNCFCFQSPAAEIEIQLALETHVDSFELEHIPAELSPTKQTKSAPKDFGVYVINQLNGGKRILIGSFTYANNPKQLVQVFNLKPVVKVNSLIFVIKSNHGHPDYTCIYRIAVYGSTTK